MLVKVKPAKGQAACATIVTKRPAGVDLILAVKAGQVALGEIRGYGTEQSVEPGRDGSDQVELRFTQVSEVNDPGFRTFLKDWAMKSASVVQPGCRSSVPARPRVMNTIFFQASWSSSVVQHDFEQIVEAWFNFES